MQIIFNPQDILFALIGGCLIGGSASLLMLMNGRVAGISGIFTGIFTKPLTDKLWRIYFVLGLIVGGFIALNTMLEPFLDLYQPSTVQVIVAGLLVGSGTQIGGGCTSGHGVCGVSRLSARSIMATLIFIISGVITVSILRSL